MTTQDNTLERLKARGIDFRVETRTITNSAGEVVHDKDGNPLTDNKIIILSIPDLERDVNKFYSEYTPCWFDGCEELRAEYKAELESGDTKGCKGCQKGAIMRKYESRVRDLINRANAKHPNPRTATLPRPDVKSSTGVKSRPAVLRWARSCFAQIRNYCPGTRKN